MEHDLRLDGPFGKERRRGCEVLSCLERFKIELFSQHPDEDDYIENEDRDVKNIQIVYQILIIFL